MGWRNKSFVLDNGLFLFCFTPRLWFEMKLKTGSNHWLAVDAYAPDDMAKTFLLCLLSECYTSLWSIIQNGRTREAGCIHYVNHYVKHDIHVTDEPWPSKCAKRPEFAETIDKSSQNGHFVRHLVEESDTSCCTGAAIASNRSPSSCLRVTYQG